MADEFIPTKKQLWHIVQILTSEKLDMRDRVAKLENTVAGHKAEIALLKKRKPSCKPIVIAPYDKPYSVTGEL